MRLSWPRSGQEPIQKPGPRHTDVVKRPPDALGRGSGTRRHRARVRRRSTTRRSLIRSAAPGLYSGPVPSVSSTSTRATPHGFDRIRPLEPLGQAEQALAPGPDRSPGTPAPRRSSAGRRVARHPSRVREATGPAGGGFACRSAAGPQRAILDRIGRRSRRPAARSRRPSCSWTRSRRRSGGSTASWTGRPRPDGPAFWRLGCFTDRTTAAAGSCLGHATPARHQRDVQIRRRSHQDSVKTAPISFHLMARGPAAQLLNSSPVDRDDRDRHRPDRAHSGRRRRAPSRQGLSWASCSCSPALARLYLQLRG